MQQLVGYKLVNDVTQEVIRSWGGALNTTPDLPNPIDVPDVGRVYCPSLNTSYGGYTLVEWLMDEPPPPDPIPPSVISDRQFFQQLAIAGVITQDEALAAVCTGTIPAALLTIIDSFEDPGQKFAAKMLVSGAVAFERTHPMTLALASAMGWSEQQINDLWSAASQL